MNNFISIIWENGNVDEAAIVESIVNSANIPLTENETNYIFGKTDQDSNLLRIAIEQSLSANDCDVLAEEIAHKIFEMGLNDFDIEITTEGDVTDEETYEGDDFFEEYGTMWFNEDEALDEAEYQGRKVSLGKPMQGDVKKFKVYVKKPGGNVVKVNFGDPDMKIKKSNPARRRSFRARHNCDNPGPRHKARYWSCRKW